MNNLTGTGALIRLALRRDRIMLPIWIAVLGLMPASVADAYETFYPTAAEQAALTETIRANPSVAVLYGPAFDLSTAGGFTAWRVGGLLALFTGLLAIFTVTRHTRAEEETGRGELLASAAVGRSASLTAAVAVAGGASVLIGAIEAIVLIASDLPVAGAMALGLATAATGLVFTAVAAVACQLAEYSRTANGLGASVVGLAFLLRAVGDSSTGARWLSWMSPIGWAQQLRPFAGERWWMLVLPALAAAAGGALAYALLPRRDLGAGVLPPRPGPAQADPGLASPGALAWRLQRGPLIGWLVAMVTCGAVFGSIAEGIGDLVGDSERAQEMFERLGGSAALVDSFLAALAGIYGMIVAFYGVQAILRLRTEETAGRAETLLATPVQRLQWAASHLAVAFGGTAAMLLAAGAATGLTHGLRTAAVGDAVGDNVAAAAAQIPATWLIVAIGVTLFGVAPKLTIAAWGVAGGAVAIGMFGPVLDLPQGALDVSPFSHVPKLPGADFTALPLAVLSAGATLALAAGLGAFRRRDIG